MDLGARAVHYKIVGNKHDMEGFGRMYPDTPDIECCPVCAHKSAPVLVRDSDEVSRLGGRVAPGPGDKDFDPYLPHWYVICDYTKGGCGTRGGYRSNPKDAINTWNIRRKPVRKEGAASMQQDGIEAKFFKALDTLGTDWRGWADKFHNMFMRTSEALDKRLLAIENRMNRKGRKADKQKPVKPTPVSKEFRFNRAGFKFHIVANEETGVTQGNLLAFPKRYMPMMPADGSRFAATTKLVAPDKFIAEHGAQIVLMKLVAKIKSHIMGIMIRQVPRERARLDDLKFHVRGAIQSPYPPIRRGDRKKKSKEV